MAEISLREYITKVENFIRDARLDEAIAHAGHILKKYPKNAAAYRDLGRALMRKQRYEQAGEIFRRLLAAVPDDFSSHYQLSIVYENTNNGNEALWHIERAFDQQPNNANVNERMRTLYKKFRNQDIGKIQLTAGAVANQYVKAGMYNEAIEILQRTLAKAPDRVDLRLLLARAYWDSGEIIEAAEASLEVLKLTPYAVEANRILTELWLSEDRPSDAQRYLSRLEDIDPYLAYEIATDSGVLDEQFMLEELDYKKYAVSLTSQQSPDWLDNLGEIEVEQESDVEIAEEPLAAADDINLVEESDTDWLADLDSLEESVEESEDPVPSNDLSDIFGDDFDIAEDDDLDALLGDVAEESDDDWLADIMADSDEPEERAEKVDTGGLLGKLGITEDDSEEDDSWLVDVRTGRFDTGPLRSIEDVLDEDEPEEEVAPPNQADMVTMQFDNIESEAALDSLEWVDDIESDDPLITEDEGDPMSWLEEAGIDLEEEADATSAAIHQANDPMAWMDDTGIEFDDAAENPLDSLFEDDEPTALESTDVDPLAWLGGTDIEVTQTGELDDFGEEDAPEDSLAWMSDIGIEFEEEDFIAEEATDDPMAWINDEGLDVDDEVEPESEKSTTDQLAWLQDDSVLDEMLDLASLTDEHPVVNDMDWESSTAAEEDWASASQEDDEGDMELDWLDDSDDDDLDPEQADDSMAWMSEEDDLEPEQADDTMAWMNEEDDLEPEQADDTMAWMNEEGLEIEDELGDEDYLTSSPQDMTRDFSSDDESEALPDFLSEVEAEEEPTGKTGMLDFLNADADVEVTEDWLSDFNPDETFDDEVDWLTALDENETESADEFTEAEVSDWAESNDDEEALDWTVGDEEIVATEADWLSDMSDERNDEFDGLDNFDDEQEEAEPVAADADWLSDLSDDADDFDFGDEEQEAEPVAAEADWLTDLDEDADDFDFGDEEQEAEPVAADADWLTDLDEDADDFDFGDEEQEAEPVAAEADWLTDLDEDADDFDFGEEEQEAEPVAAEADWLTDLDEDADDFDFGEEEQEAEPVAAEADWLTDLDEDEDDFDFGDEEQEAEPVAAEADWLSDLDEDADDFDFGDEEQEAEPVAADADWLTDLDEDADDFDFGDEEQEAEPVAADADWLTDLDEDSDDFDFGDEEQEAEPVAAEADWLTDLDEDADDFDFGEEEQEAEPVAADADWLTDLDEDSDDFDFGDEEQEAEPVAAEADWLTDLDEDADDFDFGEEEQEAEPVAADADWLTDLDEDITQEDAEAAADEFFAALDIDTESTETDAGWGDLGETGMTGELEPTETGWGDLGETGMTGELEPTETGWGDLGETGMTGELEPTETGWGDLGETGMTDDLEPAADSGWGDLGDDDHDDWLSGIGVQEPEPEIEDTEDVNIPSEPTGMSDLIQTIRSTRETGMLEIDDEDELDDEPHWLDTIDEIPAISDDMIEEETVSQENIIEEEEEDIPEPLEGGTIAGIDWSDLGPSTPDDDFEEEAEFVQQSAEEDWEAESLETISESDEELEPSAASNAPDWLNAMVPGLDLDFEAVEDEPVDEAYDDYQTSFRGRSLNEGATVDDFAWLNTLVEEETGMMEAIVDEEEEVVSSPPPPPMGLQEVARFVFSKLPAWTQKAAQSESVAAMELPDYMSDFDDESDLDFDDEFDDDFEFEDFEDDFD